MWSLFTRKKIENKCKNKHKVQIKLSKVQTCTTDLASYSLTQWQFWQLTLKWLSRARARDKNKHCYCCFFVFLFLFNYAIQGKSITWLVNSPLSFRMQFNAEFTSQVMNFPIEQPFYENYLTLDIHTNTVISHAFAYSSRWRRKPWQGLLFNIYQATKERHE